MKIEIQNILRQRVFEMLGQQDKKSVVKHFLDEGINRSTIYSIISRYEKGLEPIGRKKPGRPSILVGKTGRKLLKAATNRVGVSTRKLGRKYGISHEGVRKFLIKKGLKYRKRSTVPKHTPKQLEIIPKRARLLRRKFLKPNVTIIQDDEKYFTFGNSQLSQNSGFFTKSKKHAPESVKFVKKTKFEPKVLVWAAISVRGVSTLYIQASRGEAINADNYIKNCLSRLEKFIAHKHSDIPRSQILFWPDLASSHYASKTLDWLRSRKIKFVPKEANPPNVPQVRPIEHYWALLCQEVYKNGWEAKTTTHLVNRIRSSVKKLDLKVVQAMMSSVPIKVRSLEEHGPLAGLK